MSTREKHPIADAGIEHGTPDEVPARRNDPPATEPPAVAITNKRENEREIPTNVMPDWEEL